MLFIAKIMISACLIAFASWFAGRKPVLAGFIIALPIASMLGLLFAWYEHKNMERINEFAVSILVAIPLSLMFFLPFVLNRWLKWNFIASYLAGIACILIAYGVHQIILKR